VTGGFFRYAVALANPTAVPISALIFLDGSNGEAKTKRVDIPAHSQVVRFVDEWFTVPSATELNIFEILSTSTFNVTALLYVEGKFTTLVPATLP
jgi:hypothetical protein